MTEVDYHVQYVNQKGAIVRDVLKTGAVGDTVSVTPNQLDFGFETIVADPKSLLLDEDSAKNVVTFKVMQEQNDMTISSYHIDNRVKTIEDLIDREFYKKGVLWEGVSKLKYEESLTINFIHLINEDMANIKNGIELNFGATIAPLNGYASLVMPLSRFGISNGLVKLTKKEILSQLGKTISFSHDINNTDDYNILYDRPLDMDIKYITTDPYVPYINLRLKFDPTTIQYQYNLNTHPTEAADIPTFYNFCLLSITAY